MPDISLDNSTLDSTVKQSLEMFKSCSIFKNNCSSKQNFSLFMVWCSGKKEIYGCTFFFVTNFLSIAKFSPCA